MAVRSLPGCWPCTIALAFFSFLLPCARAAGHQGTGSSCQDETCQLGLEACLDIVIKRTYNDLGDSRAPDHMERLRTFEVEMEKAGCSWELPPEAESAVKPAPNETVGPKAFAESLWARREASPRLLQMQPVGLYADPQALLRLQEDCLRLGHEWKDPDSKYYHSTQNWTFCTLLDTEEGIDTGIWRETLGFLLEPLEKSSSLRSLEYSTLHPQMLVEWHADESFALLNSKGLKCNVSADQHFRHVESRDKSSGWRGGIVRLHIPISDQAGISYVMSGAAVRLRAGEMVVFDFHQPHTVFNVDATPRTNLLIDFNLTALQSAQSMRTLLGFKTGRMILSAVLRLGYQDPQLSEVRDDLQKLLYEYLRSSCRSEHAILTHTDDFRRLLRERSFANLPELGTHLSEADLVEAEKNEAEEEDDG